MLNEVSCETDNTLHFGSVFNAIETKLSVKSAFSISSDSFSNELKMS